MYRLKDLLVYGVTSAFPLANIGSYLYIFTVKAHKLQDEKFENFQCALCAPREIQLKLNDHSQFFSFSNYMLTQIYRYM